MNGVLNQGNNQWESSFIRWSWVLSKLNMNLSFQKRNLTYCHHVPTIFFPFTSQTFKSRACGFTFYINNYLYESKFSTRNLHQMLCSSHIKIWNLAKYLKKQNKNIKMLDLLMKNWKLRVWCSLFHFFMWFTIFQILICELQSIWCKLLVLSWLYVPWTKIIANYFSVVS